ncbi:hypothetical protein Emed_002263 [Eimeria media]
MRKKRHRVTYNCGQHQQHTARGKNSCAHNLSGSAPLVRHTWQDGPRLHLSAKVSLALTDSGAGFLKGSKSSRRRNSVDLHFSARKDSSPEGEACTRHSGCALAYSEPSRSRARRGSVGRGDDTRCKYAEDGDWHKHGKSLECSCNAGNRHRSLEAKERSHAYRIASASPRVREHDEACPAYSSRRWDSSAKRSSKGLEGTWRKQEEELSDSEKLLLHKTERLSFSAGRDVERSGDSQNELTANPSMSTRMKDESHKKMLLSSFKSEKQTKPGEKEDPLEASEDLRRLSVHRSSRRSGSADTLTKEDCGFEFTSSARSRAAPLQTRRSSRRQSSTEGNATSKTPQSLFATDLHATRTLSKTTQTHVPFPSRLEESYPVEQEGHKVSQAQGASSRRREYQHTPRVSRAEGTPSPSRLLESAGVRRVEESRVLDSFGLSKKFSASTHARGSLQDEQRGQDAQRLEIRRSSHESISRQHAEHGDISGVHRGGSASARFSELPDEANVPLSSKSLRGDEMRSYESSGSVRRESSTGGSQRRQGSASQSAEAAAKDGTHENVGGESSMHLRQVFGSASSSSGMSRRRSGETLSSSVRGSTGGSASSMGEAETQEASFNRLSYGEGSKRSERSEKQMNEGEIRLSHASGSESVTRIRSSTRTSMRSDGGEVLRQSNREGAEGPSAGRRQGSTSRKAGEEAGDRRVDDGEKPSKFSSLDSAGMRRREESLRSSRGSASNELSSSAGTSRARQDTEGVHDAEERESRKSRRESHHTELGDVGREHRGGSASARLSEISEALSGKLSRSYESSGGRESSRRGSQKRQGSAGDEGREPNHGSVGEESSMHVRGVFGSASSSSAMSRGSVKESLSSSVRGSTGGSAGSSMGETESQGPSMDRLSYGEGSKRSERSEKQTSEGEMRFSHVSGGASATGSRSLNTTSVRSDGEVLRQSNREGAEGAVRRQGSTSLKAGEEAGEECVGDAEKGFKLSSLDSVGMRRSEESLRLKNGSASNELSSSAGKSRALQDIEGAHDAEEHGSRRSRRESIGGEQAVHHGGSASARLSERSSEVSVGLSNTLSRGDEMRSYESSGSVGRESSRRGSQRRQGSVTDEGRELHNGNAGEESSMHLRGVFGSASSRTGMSRGSVKESLSSSVKGSTGGSASSTREAESQRASVDRLSYGEGSKRSERSGRQTNEADLRLSHVSGSESVTGSRASTRTSVRSDGGEIFRQSDRERAEGPSAGRRQGSTSHETEEEAGERRVGDGDKTSRLASLDSEGMRRRQESLRSSSGSASNELALSAGTSRPLHEDEGGHDAEQCGSRRSRRESQYTELGDVGGMHRGGSASARLSERSSEISAALSGKLSRGDEMRSYASSGSVRRESSRRGSQRRQGSVTDEGRKLCNENVGEESSMHLHQVFASASSRAGMSKGSVKESLSSSVKGSTGGSASSMGEAESQRASLDKLSHGEGSKRSERSERQTSEGEISLSRVSGGESVTGSRSSTRTSVRSEGGEVLRQSNREGAEGAVRRQLATSRKAGEEAETRRVGDGERASKLVSLDNSGMRRREEREESLRSINASASNHFSVSAGTSRAFHDGEGGNDAEESGSRRSRRESIGGQQAELGNVGGASARLSELSSEVSMGLSSKLSRGDEIRSYESSGSMQRESSGRGSQRRQGSFTTDGGREPDHGNLGEESSMHVRGVFTSASSSSAMSRGSVKESLSSSLRDLTGGSGGSMGEAERQRASLDRLSYREASKRSERSEKQIKGEDVRLSHVDGGESITRSQSSTRTSVRSDGEVLGQSNRGGAEGAVRRQGSTREKSGEDAGERRVGDGEKASKLASLDSTEMRRRGESLRSSNVSSSNQLSSATGTSRALHDVEGRHHAEEFESRRSRRESIQAELGDVGGVHRGGSASARFSEVSEALSGKLSSRDEMRSYESTGSVRRESSRRGSQRRQGSTSQMPETVSKEGLHGNVGEQSSMHLRQAFGSASSSSTMSRESGKESLSSSVRGSTGGRASSMGEAKTQGASMDRLSYGEGSKRSERSEKLTSEEEMRLSHVSGSYSMTGSRASTRTSVRSDGCEVQRQSNREGAEGAVRRQGSTSRKAGEEAGERRVGDGEEPSKFHSLDRGGTQRREESLRLSSGSASNQLSLSAGNSRALHDLEDGKDAKGCGGRGSRRESIGGQQAELGDVSGASARLSERSSEISVALSSGVSRGDEMKSYESSGSVRRESSRRGSQRRQGSATDEGKEPHHGSVGEESRMHLRGVFGSASSSSATSRGSLKESLSSSVRGSTGGSASSMGEAESHEQSLDRFSYGEGSKRGEGSEKRMNEGEMRLSQVGGSESVTGSRSSTRTSVRSDGSEVLKQSIGEGAEGAVRRHGSTSRKSGEEAEEQRVGYADRASKLASLDSAGMQSRGESLRLSSASASNQLSLSAGSTRAFHDVEGENGAEERGSRRSRRESISGQQSELGDVSGVQHGGSATARLSGRSSEVSVALSNKLSRGDEIRSYESSGSVRRERSRRGSQRSAGDEGRESHNGNVGEESSIHLRQVFGSARSSSAMSRGSVKESLSSSVRGSTGGSTGSMGEAKSQGAIVTSLGFEHGSKSSERSKKELKEEDVRLSHAGASDSLTGSGVSTRSSLGSDAKSRGLSSRGPEFGDSVDLQETETRRSGHFEDVGSTLSSWKTADNIPMTSQDKAGTSMSRVSGSLCGTDAQLAKSRGGAAQCLPLSSTSEDERLQSCKETSGRFSTSRLSTSSHLKAASATPVFNGLQTPRLGADEESMRREKGNVGNVQPRKTQQACESGKMLWDKTTMNFSESSALYHLAHGSCNSPEMLANVLNSAVTSTRTTSSKTGTRSANRPVESSSSRLLSGPGELGSWQLTHEAMNGSHQPLVIEQHQRGSRNAGATPLNFRGTITNSWASNLDESASEGSKLQRSTATGEAFESLKSEGSAACLRDGLQTQESTTDLNTSRLIAQQDGSKIESSRSSRRRELQQAPERGPTHVDSQKRASDSRMLTATSSKRSTSSFCTALSSESSFASAETMTSEASRSTTNSRSSAVASGGHTSSNNTTDADESSASSTQDSLSSRRRRNSAGDVESARLRADIDWRRAHEGRPKKSNFPVATYSRPSYIDRTAMGRRLTAQNDMWSRVGSYEPLSSAVFHGVFPTLPSELQKLCMQCVGTPDSPELRSLTDIQKAAMALVAKQSVRKSLVAKSRIAREFKKRGQPLEALELIEQFLLTCVPILIYFDIASLTPHLAQGGYYRSHFEIPQTDATYLRKCNEREQAFYSGLYEHESVRPEHHPKYGYVSLNCVIQPPWEPQSGEACLILKDHVRKDVDAIAVPKCSAHDRAMVAKLQSIATRYMVPLISMEHFPRAVKDDAWKHVLRHLQHEVLLKKTSLGNTYGQI